MSEAPALIYLEADDEITTVVRRLADAEPGRIVIVAPGRSRATSSTVALRLLARAAERAGREVSVVGDALTRSLAVEAGLVAYASVADAREARPVSADPAEAHTATIHVVRGPLDDESVPKLAASGDLDETVAVPVARPRPAAPAAARRAPASPRGARRVSLPLLLGGLAAILVASVAIAAVVLPAAPIRIVPRTTTIGPVVDVIAIADPERVQGTVDESVTVTATAPYEVNDPSIGTVVFLNWNFSPVEVPAGSLVANGDQAGDQAFETTDVIIVPAGEFDPFQGGITAGEAGVGVRAVAPGPDGNVAAEAIDTVLDPNLAGQLRGFPTITERLVVNPDATAGGATEEGVEFSQEDVDAAVAALTEALESAVDDALAESQGMVSADPLEPATPTIEIPDDLVGRRDAETVELSGSLAYDRLAVDAAGVTARAIERFHADASLLPAGHEIVESATEVTIGEVRRDGDGLEVDVSVAGEAIATVARDALLDLVIGRSAAEAEAALAGIGAASVDLWPAWVSTVPDSDWRIDLQVGDPPS